MIKSFFKWSIIFFCGYIRFIDIYTYRHVPSYHHLIMSLYHGPKTIVTLYIHKHDVLKRDPYQLIHLLLECYILCWSSVFQCGIVNPVGDSDFHVKFCFYAFREKRWDSIFGYRVHRKHLDRVHTWMRFWWIWSKAIYSNVIFMIQHFNLKLS